MKRIALILLDLVYALGIACAASICGMGAALVTWMLSR